MKVEKIEQKGSSIFEVHLVPTKIEKFFGRKPKTVKYKDSGSDYMFGGQTVYVREDGTQTRNGDWIAEKIDRWRRSF